MFSIVVNHGLLVKTWRSLLLDLDRSASIVNLSCQYVKKCGYVFHIWLNQPPLNTTLTRRLICYDIENHIPRSWREHLEVSTSVKTFTLLFLSPPFQISVKTGLQRAHFQRAHGIINGRNFFRKRALQSA